MPSLERFTVPLPEYLRCPICLEAAYPPVVVCPNEHLLCAPCIDAHLDAVDDEGDEPRCPLCRSPLRDELNVSPAFRRAIDSYGCAPVGFR